MKGHGKERAQGEKGQRVFTTAESRRARREQLKREEEEWASKNGPVEVRKKDK